MREDVLKTRLVSVKEVAAASKARSDRQVAQLTSEKDATVDAMRELRNSVAERWVSPTWRKLGYARLG